MDGWRTIELLRQVMHKLLDMRPGITQWEELRVIMLRINPHLEEDIIIRNVGADVFRLVMVQRKSNVVCITP